MTHQQPEESFDQVVERLRARGLVTDRTSMPMNPTPTPPTPAGSSEEREALISVLHGCILSIDETKAAQAADLCLAAGFTRAHGETWAGDSMEVRLDIERQAIQAEHDALRAERDALAEKLHARDDVIDRYAMDTTAAIARADVAEDALRSNGFTNNPGAMLPWKPPVNEAAGANWRKLIAAEQRAARLADILRYVRSDLVCSCMDDSCVACSIDRALAGNAATDGDRHVHFNVQAMNDDGDLETPLPPMMSLADARERALDIAEDYPRGVEIHRVVVASERVWTNAPLPAPPAANAATKETR